LSGIFVSYRRSDSQGEAGRLFDDLVKHFGEDSVFMDVAAIEAGRDFRKAIEEGVTKCGVLLVVIGTEWHDARDEHGVPRLNDPSDFVRIETASALKRDIPVIPVLVRGAQMPTAEQLPDDLKELAYRNCIELTHARWRSDIPLLIEALRRLLGNQAGAIAGPAGPRSGEQGGQRDQAPAKREGGRSAVIDAASQQRVAHELALRIGPIAGIVVRRAAPQCDSLDELYHRVAEEIDSREERERFLREGAADASPRSHETAEPAVPVQPEAPRAAVRSESNNAPSATVLPRAKAEVSRNYLVVIGGIAALLIVALIFGMRFAPSKGAASSQPKLAPSRETPEAAPAKSPASPPPVETAVKNDKAVSAPATRAAGNDEPATVKRFTVGEEVARNLLISAVVPDYPALARQAKVKGLVRLNANISKEGKVESIRVIEGHPLLIESALKAAEQMRYKPYLQNGEPVAINTEIDVLFTLTSQ